MRPSLTARLQSAREAKLLRPSAQRHLAANLDRAVDRAGRRVGVSAAVPVSARAAGRDREALRQLSARLAAADATDARGIAQARRLLTDPESPLFGDRDPDALWLAARDALLALGPTPERRDERVADAPAPARAQLRH